MKIGRISRPFWDFSLLTWLSVPFENDLFCDSCVRAKRACKGWWL